MNKALKITLISIITIITILYFSILLIVPYVIDLAAYTPQIKQEVKNATGLNIEINDIKPKTTWNLNAGALITDIKLGYQDKASLLSLSEADLEFAILPLVFKKLVVKKIVLKDPQLFLYRQKNGEYKINSILEKLPKTNEEPSVKTSLIGTKIFIDNYLIQLADNFKGKENNYVVKGEKLYIDNFTQDKKIDLHAIGKVITNDQKLIAYNMKIDTELPKTVETENESGKTINNNNYIDFTPLEKLAKYKFNADIATELKIRNINKAPRIEGIAQVTNLSLNSNGVKLPNSHIILNFKDSNADIDAKLYTAPKEHIRVVSKLDVVTLNPLELEVKTKGLSLSNLNNLMILLADISGADITEAKKIVMNGIFFSDFSFFTDQKKLEFKGNAELKNTNISLKGLNRGIRNLNMTFESDNGDLLINNSSGKIDETNINISGVIKKNTQSDITVEIPVLDLNTLFLMVKNIALPKELKKQLEDITHLSGIVDIDIDIKGLLKDLKPKIEAELSTITLNHKQLGTSIYIDSGEIEADAVEASIENLKLEALRTPIFISGKVKTFAKEPSSEFSIKVPKFEIANIKELSSSQALDPSVRNFIDNLTSLNGNISVDAKMINDKLNGKISFKKLSGIYNPLKFKVSLPGGTITLDEKVIDIGNIIFDFGSSPIKISGSIKDYSNNADINIVAKGDIFSQDINKLLNQGKVIKSGHRVPLLAKIKGQPEKLAINAQINFDKNLPLPIVQVKEIKKLNKIINISINTDKNRANLNGTGLYTISKLKWTDDTAKNLVNAKELISISGYIENTDKPNSTLKNVVVSVPQELSVYMPKMDKISFKVRGKLTAVGNINTPNLNVNADLSNINVPTMKTKISSLSVNTKNNNLIVETDSVKIADSVIAVKAVVDAKASTPLVVKSLEVSSDYLDTDKLAAAKASDTPPPVKSPVVVNYGGFKVKQLKADKIVATDISAKFKLSENNILTVSGINANALGGKHSGSAVLNMYNNKTSLDMFSQGMSGDDVAEKVLMLPGQISGTINSKLNITTMGTTPEQMNANARGTIAFNAKNGQLGGLGQMEFFLNAANLAGLDLGRVFNTLQPKKTGQFDTLEGKINLYNGIANVEYIQTRGKELSMFIYGNTNIINNTGNLIVLGRTSMGVVNALGPLSKFSMSELLGKIPTVGIFAQQIYQAYQVDASSFPTDKIPPLSDPTIENREFLVRVNGNLASPKAVKQFKWITSD